MAVTNAIPPQAYTRDVLVKAIDWVGSQPQAIREKATSADLLVSYYIQACRRNSAQMEAPVSQENFKNDLKHLAEGLKKFEDPIAPPPPNRFPSYGHQDTQFRKVEPIFAPPPPSHQAAQQSLPNMQQPQAYPAPEGYIPQAPAYPANSETSYTPTTPVYRAPPPHSPPAPKVPTWSIDPRSLAAARDIQQRLNLSNEGEALRFLISLGTERLRELFP